MIFWYVVPYLAAIADNESPLLTVYVVVLPLLVFPEVFELPVDAVPDTFNF